MPIKCDTHLHTQLSVHAVGTVQDLALAAKNQGLEAIVVTDHCSLQMCHFEQSVDVLLAQQLPRFIEGVRIFKGAEIDIVDYKGHLCFYNIPYDAEQSALDRLLENLEVAIASPHYPPEDRQGSYEEVTEMFLRLIAHPKVTILGHPERIGTDYDMTAVALAAAQNGTFLECNNVSLQRNYRDKIKKMLQLCKLFGTYIVVGSDSHDPQYVGRFSEAYQLLHEVDFPEELIANRTRAAFEKALARQKQSKAAKK
ncbi:MAG: PHP domain-containing protein [Clostridiales bacterium]|nr:PHP domain-containing protein [Clostridiales bacterium]